MPLAATGQRLTVRVDGVWHDSVVEAAESGVTHRVRLDDGGVAAPRSSRGHITVREEVGGRR